MKNEKTRHSLRRPCLVPTNVFAAALTAMVCFWFGPLPLRAQMFQITGVRVRTDGCIVLSYPAETNSYYVMYGGDLTNITQATALRLGTNGLSEIAGPNVRTNTGPGFFRLRQVPLAQPLDSDGDGWDDLTELAENSNPLDPTSRPRIMVFSGPPVAMLLPSPTGTEGVPANTAAALPPASLLLPVPTGAEGLSPNTTFGHPPAALLLPSNQGAEGVPLNTSLGRPPVSLEHAGF